MSYSELAAYHSDFSTGYWADEPAEACPCHGHGWALSQVDTWHKCPCHFDGQPHPESDEEEYDAWEVAPDSYFVDAQNHQRGEPQDDDIPF